MTKDAANVNYSHTPKHISAATAKRQSVVSCNSSPSTQCLLDMHLNGIHIINLRILHGGILVKPHAIKP